MAKLRMFRVTSYSPSGEARWKERALATSALELLREAALDPDNVKGDDDKARYELPGGSYTIAEAEA